MKHIFLIIIISMLNSCTIYKDTRSQGDREIKEWGVCSYDKRPIAQNDSTV